MDSKHRESESPVPKERDFAPVQLNQEQEDHNRFKTEHLSDSDSDTTATNDSDEFDWDDEDEPQDNKQKQPKAKRGRAIYLAFMKLARPVRVILYGFLGAGILITPLIVVHTRFSDSAAKQQVHVWSMWLTIAWVAGCLTSLGVDLLPKLVVGLVVLFGGKVESLKIQIELTMAVSHWLKLALDISWAWIALSVIRSIYNPDGSYWYIINRVMQALFAAGVILLAEKIFLHFVAINFHEKALSERLAENRLGLKALDRLSNAQPAPKKASPYGKNRGHKSVSGSVDFLNGHSKKTSVAGSPVKEKNANESKAPTSRKPPRRRSRKPVTVIVDQLGDVLSQLALKNSKFNRETESGSLYSARKLAKKLFTALKEQHPDRDSLVVEDFEPYFKSTAEAHTAFHLFDKDGNGDLSKREMREAVQRIYRERKSLIASLKDASSVVAKLDGVLLCVALVGIIFVCLLIFSRANTLESLVPLATIILGFSFVFGHSAQTIFESLIFIFSTHVFDVGDLVLIDDQPLFVKEFGLFSTVFTRVDGQEIIAPNAVLASSKLIHNVRRSHSMVETTPLMISYDTPLEIIEELRSRLAAYVNENSREWCSSAVLIDKMEYQNAIHLTIVMEHRPNWQDWGGRWNRRNGFMRNMRDILEALDIRYTMPVQPILLPRGGQLPSRGGGDNRPHPSSTAGRDELGNAGSFSSQPTRPGRGFRADNTGEVGAF